MLETPVSTALERSSATSPLLLHLALYIHCALFPKFYSKYETLSTLDILQGDFVDIYKGFISNKNVWFSQDQKVKLIEDREINGTYPAFSQEFTNWKADVSYTSFGKPGLYDQVDIEHHNKRLFRGHTGAFVQRKITKSVMDGSDWRNKEDLSFVDMLPGSAFNMLVWGTNLDVVLSTFFDILQTIQGAYCVWSVFKYLHSEDSCIQCRILDMLGCGRCIRSKDDDDDDDGDNANETDVAVNNYFELPNAPPHPPEV